MKNRISIAALICALTLVSCVPPPPCETPVNGFLTGTSKQIKMGNEDAVNVFKQLDIAWGKLDYEKMKTFISDDAYLSFDDGFVATTPQEFIDKIKTEVAKTQAAGNNYEWTTNFAFAVAHTDDGDDETKGEVGDWVNAQFTSKPTNPNSEIDSEVIYEYYYIVEGKVTFWNQFKKTIKK